MPVKLTRKSPSSSPSFLLHQSLPCTDQHHSNCFQSVSLTYWKHHSWEKVKQAAEQSSSAHNSPIYEQQPAYSADKGSVSNLNSQEMKRNFQFLLKKIATITAIHWNTMAQRLILMLSTTLILEKEKEHGPMDMVRM